MQAESLQTPQEQQSRGGLQHRARDAEVWG